MPSWRPRSFPSCLHRDSGHRNIATSALVQGLCQEATVKSHAALVRSCPRCLDSPTPQQHLYRFLRKASKDGWSSAPIESWRCRWPHQISPPSQLPLGVQSPLVSCWASSIGKDLGQSCFAPCKTAGPRGWHSRTGDDFHTTLLSSILHSSAILIFALLEPHRAWISLASHWPA